MVYCMLQDKKVKKMCIISIDPTLNQEHKTILPECEKQLFTIPAVLCGPFPLSTIFFLKN